MKENLDFESHPWIEFLCVCVFFFCFCYNNSSIPKPIRFVFFFFLFSPGERTGIVGLFLFFFVLVIHRTPRARHGCEYTKNHTNDCFASFLCTPGEITGIASIVLFVLVTIVIYPTPRVYTAESRVHGWVRCSYKYRIRVWQSNCFYVATLCVQQYTA